MTDDLGLVGDYGDVEEDPAPVQVNGYHEQQLPAVDRGDMPTRWEHEARPVTEKPAAKLYAPKLYTSAEFFRADFRREFLVRGVLVNRQPAVIGGGKKLLKSGIVIDLAVSLDTATPFLGFERFTVPRRANVLLLNGESGEATIQETAARVAKAHHVNDVKELGIVWGADLPQLANVDHLNDLANILEERSIEVLIIDPSYLCLLTGTGPDGPRQSSLFDMGPHYKRLADTCLLVGCTPILVSHAKKGRSNEAADLDDLAFAGIAEWARQWILLSRREKYEGDGVHKLWLSVGGSAGHSTVAHLDVEEGTIDDLFSGRRWEATVTPYNESLRQRKADRESAKAADRSSDELAVMKTIDELIAKDGMATQRRIRQASGLSKDRTDAALQRNRLAGLIEEHSVSVVGGNGAKQLVSAFRRVDG